MTTSHSQSIFRVALGCSALLISAAGCSRAPEAPPKTVELNVDDKMKFDLSAFEVKAGQKVSVTLKNIGTSPKASMGHNFVLLNRNANMDKFAEAASMHAASDYVPPEMKKDVIAHTKLLGPGESETVTFTAPQVPGDYNYLCSFPGHYTQGAKGIMTVK